MLSKPKLTLFWKTFLLSFVMLLAIIGIAYILLYFLLPGYYEDYKNEQYEQLASELVSSLEQATDAQEEQDLLSQFLSETGASLEVLDGKGSVLYQASEVSEVSLGHEGESLEIATELEVGDNADSLEYSYLVRGEQRTLRVQFSLESIAEAQAVIGNVYPLAILVCVFVSFVMAALLSRFFTKPIKEIQQASVRMARLEPEISIPVTSQDEFGDLSRDIESLYAELRDTIVKLEQETEKYSDSENKKISFLQTVSHELKTPLASANALIEGMICQVPPYDESPMQYLEECKSFLDKAIGLTKETLSLSQGYQEEDTVFELSALMNEVVSPYNVILRSKQVSYTSAIPDDMTLSMRKGMLSKVLSNIVSNAANYTPEGGTIGVTFENDVLMVENTCDKIPEQLDLFASFQSPNKDNELSSGLGLYIVNQLLRLLEIPYSFEPGEHERSMCFSLNLRQDEE